jgi:hypothetical protein
VAGRVEVEEDCAAAEERLDLPFERAWIESPQLRKKLPLAGSPLQ